MAQDARPDKQGVGERFSLEAMVRARDLTFEALYQMADMVREGGVTEGQAHERAQRILERMGMERLWHKNVIRFGPGTLDTFQAGVEADRVLAQNDIFFIDLGVVWDGHEGDCGDSFAVGDDPEMHACAEAARTLWHVVADKWRAEGLTGEGLYRFAVARAEAMGWRFNWEVRGHRVSEFPHGVYKGGPLGDLAERPKTGLWILEIQIAHPTRPFGAFYEDLLIGDATAAGPEAIPGSNGWR